MQGRAMVWIYKTLPLLASLTVAAASFALSFVALRDVAAETDAVVDHLAWLVPIVIDGGILCASAVIWAQAALGRQRHRFPLFVVFTLVVISVIVNAAHAGDSLLAKLIAALPPLVLLATLELVAVSTKHYAAPLHASTAPSTHGVVVEQADPASGGSRSTTTTTTDTPRTGGAKRSTAKPKTNSTAKPAAKSTAKPAAKSTAPSNATSTLSHESPVSGDDGATARAGAAAARVEDAHFSVPLHERFEDDIDAELAELTAGDRRRTARVRALPPEG